MIVWTLLPVEEDTSSVVTTAVVVSGTTPVDAIVVDDESATVDESVVSGLADVAPVVLGTVVIVSTLVPVAIVASVVVTRAVVVSVFVVDDAGDSEVVVAVVTSVVGGCCELDTSDELAVDNVDDCGADVVLCVTDSVVVSGTVTPSVVGI